jgi:hypothetical protein
VKLYKAIYWSIPNQPCNIKKYQLPPLDLIDLSAKSTQFNINKEVMQHYRSTNETSQITVQHQKKNITTTSQITYRNIIKSTMHPSGRETEEHRHVLVVLEDEHNYIRR